MFGDNDSQQLQLDVTTVDLGLYIHNTMRTVVDSRIYLQHWRLAHPSNDDTVIGADNYRGIDDETIGHMF